MLKRHPRRFAAAMARAGATLPAKLIVVTAGQRDPANLSGGLATTETAVNCRGLVVQWTGSRFQGTEIQVGDRLVHLIGATLKGHVPKIGDKVAIEGRTGRIVNLGRDAAAAVWMALVRA